MRVVYVDVLHQDNQITSTTELEESYSPVKHVQQKKRKHPTSKLSAAKKHALVKLLGLRCVLLPWAGDRQWCLWLQKLITTIMLIYLSQ